MPSTRALAARRPRCPTCHEPVAWAGNPHRPFCSVGCRLVDLGGWLEERYRVPGPEIPVEGTAHDSGTSDRD